MAAENNLDFIKQRIYEIKSALLFSLSNAIVKLPTSIVTALKVDEEGQVWFLAHRPTQSLEHLEWYFPATLRFYRKGKPFYMNLSGNVVIVDQPCEMNEWLEDSDQHFHAGTNDLVLMKLTIDRVEYHESEIKTKGNFSFFKLGQQLYDWIAGSSFTEKSWTMSKTAA